MESRPEDVIISTYSKSGTTWLQTIVYNLLGCPQGPLEKLTDVAPWLQCDHEPEKLDRMINFKNPRVFKTHDLYSWLPEHWARARLIYCYRNPKDWAVSLFHHFQTFQMDGEEKIVENKDFSAFFTKLCRQKEVAPFGLWEDHVIDWLQHKDDENILFLTYEDMVEDLEREVAKIAKFLGVTLTPELLERVLHEGNFTTMRNNGAVNYGWVQGVREIQPFIRKGKVGGWKEWLTDEQSKEMDGAIEKVTAAGGRIRCSLE